MIFSFYSPSHFETWDYRNPLEVGIGGSETAHVEVAERLAKRGHKVISYSPLPKDVVPGTSHKGVEWYDLKQARFDTPGIWVIGRSPQTFKKFKHKKKDQKVWLVMQDVRYPMLDKSTSKLCDVYLPLCSTHVTVTENEHPEIAGRIVQSTNGIRTDLIESLPEQVRDPHRMMYASSPDRGLVTLLKMFPRIKAKVLDANLHVFYGFDNIEKLVDQDTPIDPYGSTIGDLRELMKQDGVFWHGRIGQKELLIEWMKTGIWAYPTQFSETSCITSMESQACGAIPVTNPFWALKDNVKYGSLIDGDPGMDGLTSLRYVEEIIYWMTKESGYYTDESEIQDESPVIWTKEGMRKQMMEEVRKRFDWDRVVDQYEQLAKL